MRQHVTAQSDICGFNGTHVAQVFHSKELAAHVDVQQEQQHGQQ
jgi:hypothetical protein